MIDDLVAGLARALGGPKEATLELDALLRLADRTGIDADDLRTDLAAVIKERIALNLIGPIRTGLNYRERSALARRRLAGMIDDAGSGLTEELVDLVSRAQSWVAAASQDAREGIRSVEETMASGLLDRQRNRCAVCHVPLRHGERVASSRFPSGYEPVFEPTLDHVLPFYLFGNNTRYEVLCKPCNLLKNDRIGVHEDGLVLCGNTFRRRDGSIIKRRMAFWTLYRERRCAAPACPSGGNALLVVAERNQDSRFGYGNLFVRCDACAPVGAYWVHEAVSGNADS